ncbi:MAG: hypothetical protein Fur005_31760 [Roseiflexaceae bacterium]
MGARPVSAAPTIRIVGMPTLADHEHQIQYSMLLLVREALPTNQLPWLEWRAWQVVSGQGGAFLAIQQG